MVIQCVFLPIQLAESAVGTKVAKITSTKSALPTEFDFNLHENRFQLLKGVFNSVLLDSCQRGAESELNSNFRNLKMKKELLLEVFEQIYRLGPYGDPAEHRYLYLTMFIFVASLP